MTTRPPISYRDAAKIADAAGRDAANRQMRACGRTAWNEEDWDEACEIREAVLTDYGFAPPAGR